MHILWKGAPVIISHGHAAPTRNNSWRKLNYFAFPRANGTVIQFLAGQACQEGIPTVLNTVVAPSSWVSVSLLVRILAGSSTPAQKEWGLYTLGFVMLSALCPLSAPMSVRGGKWWDQTKHTLLSISFFSLERRAWTQSHKNRLWPYRMVNFRVISMFFLHLLKFGFFSFPLFFIQCF